MAKFGCTFVNVIKCLNRSSFFGYNHFQLFRIRETIRRSSTLIKKKRFTRAGIMFFRPSFCANCGEKIERTNWGIGTSRRFCQVCESEFKGQDLIPRVIVGLGVLIGIFGFGSYLQAGKSDHGQIVRQPKRFVEQSIAAQTSPANTGSARRGMPTAVQQPEQAQTPGSFVKSESVPQSPVKPPTIEKSVPIYFCGAETKKGTPCSRKVKGNVRCFQHTGMPAMLPPEKLRVN